MGYCDDLDNEEHPRNAAAIRTAILLGAEFYFDEPTKMWDIKGIQMVSHNRTMPAWLFLVTHGICITKDARACLCKDILGENFK